MTSAAISALLLSAAAAAASIAPHLEPTFPEEQESDVEQAVMGILQNHLNK
ncbi:hypothetical protein JCM16418_2567 [Paenibacillus pini JCM 16418]|uniref:Uncharacterized protein n=1 Tax=Paenibacillus pini JCM 16418 TaxID=1236976 RepID=W7YV51_9BACL|nr:hypothetical protein JCM16418_2567 [Paenibacillus pini JCM 16418]